MYRLIFVLVALIATGCATKPQYFHSSLSDKPAIDRQMAIDDGYCLMSSMGSVPVPQVVSSPTNTATRTSGTISGYNGSSFSNYNYTATTRPVNNVGNAISQGIVDGMNIGAAAAAKSAQNKIYHGCMVAKGWTTDPEAATAKKEHAKASPADPWISAINEFLKTEALRPNGIDYRKSDAKMEMLDFYVKSLANNEANNDKTMLWFLVEADQLVKTKLASPGQ